MLAECVYIRSCSASCIFLWSENEKKKRIKMVKKLMKDQRALARARRIAFESWLVEPTTCPFLWKQDPILHLLRCRIWTIKKKKMVWVNISTWIGNESNLERLPDKCIVVVTKVFSPVVERVALLTQKLDGVTVRQAYKKSIFCTSHLCTLT